MVVFWSALPDRYVTWYQKWLLGWYEFVPVMADERKGYKLVVEML